MSARSINITADTTGTSMILMDVGEKDVVIKVTAASSLGGGTLNWAIRPQGSTIAIEKIDTTVVLAAGSEGVYTVGSNMEVFAILAGATNPNIRVIVSTGT